MYFVLVKASAPVNATVTRMYHPVTDFFSNSQVVCITPDIWQDLSNSLITTVFR